MILSVSGASSARGKFPSCAEMGCSEFILEHSESPQHEENSIHSIGLREYLILVRYCTSDQERISRTRELLLVAGRVALLKKSLSSMSTQVKIELFMLFHA